MSDNLLDLQHITKVYTLPGIEVPVLKDVCLAVKSLEFVAIMGASGSGKSTLMNIIGCLDRPTTGSYHFSRQEITHLSVVELAVVRNQRIGFVFQNFNLLARSNALENVELPLLYRGVSAKEARTAAADALSLVGLSTRLHHYPSQMSGGQQQRVAIARAIVTKPQLILADEPTGNLDSETSKEIMNLFTELNHSGITIMMVTHALDIARYAARVIVMKDGEIVPAEAAPLVSSKL